jgi:phosphate/sulfate permease
MYDGKEMTESEFKEYVKERESELNNNSESVLTRIREANASFRYSESSLHKITEDMKAGFGTAKKETRKTKIILIITFSITIITLMIPAVAVIFAIIFAWLLTDYLHEQKHYKRETNKRLKQLTLLESGEYEAYELEITRKLWCKSSLHGEEFYIELGDIFGTQADKKSYEMFKDKIALVILKTGEKKYEFLLFPVEYTDAGTP